MARFINPFTDIGFKRIFGQEISKPLLLDFLNEMLVGERRIVNITFLDKEQPALFEGDRSLIYDIYCETDTGEKIIVEMQNREQPFFKNRSIYYVSEAVARQGERGSGWRYDIKSVYLVAFLNFRMDGIGRKFRTDVSLVDTGTKEIFSDKLRLIYLQLPYFTKEPDECENDFERWIYVLKNMETLSRLPWAAQDSVFKRLSEIADVGSLSREERLKYDEGLRKYRDTLCVLSGAEMKGRREGLQEGIQQGLQQGIQQGIQQGMQQGMQQGVQQGLLTTARNLKGMGMSIKDICQATGLTEKEVLEI